MGIRKLLRVADFTDVGVDGVVVLLQSVRDYRRTSEELYLFSFLLHPSEIWAEHRNSYGRLEGFGLLPARWWILQAHEHEKYVSRCFVISFIFIEKFNMLDVWLFR